MQDRNTPYHDRDSPHSQNDANTGSLYIQSEKESKDNHSGFGPTTNVVISDQNRGGFIAIVDEQDSQTYTDRAFSNEK